MIESVNKDEQSDLERSDSETGSLEEVLDQNPARDPEFETLLDYLKLSRGFDFSGYKRSSLMRRVDKQMQSVGVSGYDSYLDYLEVHPDEFEQLFNTILINVTGFFRDTPAWEYFADEVVTRLLASKSGSEPIRLWSAGCATGQEPYSLAMALAEKMGDREFRERVKIYATDIDANALVQARAGTYSPREVQTLPPALLERYFEQEAGQYVFRRDLRRALIFGRHDLLQDAPISRVDMLICRNTVMYFNAEAQAQILARFHFSLNDKGTLFLGKAEMLFSHAALFTPIDLKRRLFIKVSTPGLRNRALLMGRSDSEPQMPTPEFPRPLHEAAFDASTTAQIVVDLKGSLVLANDRARALFHLLPRDIGRLLRDLEISYRPIELRSRIEQAYAERRAITVKETPYGPSSDPLFFDTLITPLLENSALLGASVTFTNVTRARQLSEEIQQANRELEAAYAELQSTNEELETTNEELQSTNEELETTNEELQSTNEELETTNEELQSTNEELQTINDEVRQRSLELNQINAYLESILTSLRSAVIVLDSSLQVQVWNRRSEDLWGLRSEEVEGQALLKLDIGLPVDTLLPLIHACLVAPGENQETTMQARNRRGRTIECQIQITPLIILDNPEGVVLLIDVNPTEEDPEDSENPHHD